MRTCQKVKPPLHCRARRGLNNLWGACAEPQAPAFSYSIFLVYTFGGQLNEA